MLRERKWGGVLATIVALAALFVVIDGAQSQQHSKQKQPTQPQSQPQQAQQASPSDQRGTEQSPLSVKVISSTKSEEDAAHERQEREEKTGLDRKLVKFNGDLANYTLALAIVAILQFIVLFVQAVFLGLALKESK